MKRYIKPEINITLIHVDSELLGASTEINNAGNGDSFAKGSISGNITWGDVWADEDIIDEDLY